MNQCQTHAHRLGALGLLAALLAGTCQAAAPDARIAAALNEISSARVQANISALIAFGTRSTLSAQDSAAIASGRGIGAAREWIRAQFEQYSKDCGGCLEVKVDSYTQQSGERLSQPTVISNVYAVLKGTEPGPVPRIVLVTGHYDSRNSDNFDTTHDAPGANDDASGVAVSLECARVLSKLKFPATIIFLAVAGEEQGLYGSEHFAHMAREHNWNIEAALNNDIVGGNRSAQQDPKVVRVFSEGLPSSPNAQQPQQIRAMGGENDSASRELARYVAETAAQYALAVQPLLIFRPDRFLRGGDHLSFNAQGLCRRALYRIPRGFHSPAPNGAHRGRRRVRRPAEVLSTWITWPTSRASTRRRSPRSLLRPAPPTQVTIAAEKLENDSTLEWSASPGASGYEVLWRATTSPVWEHAQAVAGEHPDHAADEQGQCILCGSRARRAGPPQCAGGPGGEALRLRLGDRIRSGLSLGS